MATLFALVALSANLTADDAKCGNDTVAKCGNDTTAKCGNDTTSKCGGDDKSDESAKCGAGKCGGGK